ncbi:MAG: DUF922 domain-containing protein [Phycisphaerales bacterium]
MARTNLMNAGAALLLAGCTLVPASSALGACPGDLNLDGATDSDDLSQMLSFFGQGAGGDLDGDGDTDSDDLGILLGDFGCQTGIVLPQSACIILIGARDAAGRPLGAPGPNGALELDPFVAFSVLCDAAPDCPCAGPVVLGGGVQTTTYPVNGTNLGEVSDAIFGDGGAGPMIDGTRYAGSAQLSASFKTGPWQIVDGKICYSISEVSWTTTILLPDWANQPEDLPADQKEEWDRFLGALTQHEQGHANINNQHMGAVRAQLVGAQVCIEIPEGVDLTDGLSDEERELIGDAVEASANQRFSDAINATNLDQDQTNYDDPPGADNPTGTDHGRTQGATLNTNP